MPVGAGPHFGLHESLQIPAFMRFTRPQLVTILGILKADHNAANALTERRNT